MRKNKGLEIDFNSIKLCRAKMMNNTLSIFPGRSISDELVGLLAIIFSIVDQLETLNNDKQNNQEDKIWDDVAKMMIGRTSEGCKFKWLSLSKLNL